MEQEFLLHALFPQNSIPCLCFCSLSAFFSTLSALPSLPEPGISPGVPGSNVGTWDRSLKFPGNAARSPQGRTEPGCHNNPEPMSAARVEPRRCGQN